MKMTRGKKQRGGKMNRKGRTDSETKGGFETAITISIS